MKKTITASHLRKLHSLSRRLRSITDSVQDRPFGQHCAWRLCKARLEVDELINTFDRSISASADSSNRATADAAAYFEKKDE